VYSPPAIEIEPATTAAVPAMSIEDAVAPGAAATPRTKPEVDMIPSLAPKTPALSQLSLAAIVWRWNSALAIWVSISLEFALVIVLGNTMKAVSSSKGCLSFSGIDLADTRLWSNFE
jgi:hypothetical protein